MQEMNRNIKFHLIARTYENIDVLLYEFNDDRQFYFYMDQVDKDKYKSAMILERLGYDYPTNVMYAEFERSLKHIKEVKKLEKVK